VCFINQAFGFYYNSSDEEFVKARQITTQQTVTEDRKMDTSASTSFAPYTDPLTDVTTILDMSTTKNSAVNTTWLSYYNVTTTRSNLAIVSNNITVATTAKLPNINTFINNTTTRLTTAIGPTTTNTGTTYLLL
ncbi:hypothetical protein B566_EDAN011250, partial [Ephemera danica]